MFNFLATLLAWFYSIIPSYGVAIVLLTVAVRVILFPLTAKQARSMQAMQRIQPEIKKLQAKYKNDRQKLNEEMMKFYKENDINPLSGCLPLLLQLPVFLVLYRVIHGLSKTVHGKPEPAYLSHSSQMYKDIVAAGGKLESFGMDLAESAKSAMHHSVGTAIPYLVLVALVIFTQYYQQRQMNARNPQAAQNQQAVMMARVFPVVFGFISYNIAAGVVIYFLVSNVWVIGQQAVIFRHPPDTGQTPAKPKESPKSGGDGNGAVTKPQSKPEPKPKPAAKTSSRPQLGQRPTRKGK
jgi:YidC/Oxa1 family membrane protein insertase